MIAEGQPALRACHDRLARAGVALAHYTFEDAAADVLDAARVLHLTRVNLVAASQPAPIALAVLRDAPGLVRTLTVLNPWLPTPNSIDLTAVLAAALDQYVTTCNATPACARAYPDLPGQLRRQWAALNAHPELLDATATAPAGIVVHHAVLVNGDTLAKALASVLGNPVADPLLAAAMTNPPLGLIAQYALGRDAIYAGHDFTWARYLSSACAYIPAASPGHAITSAARPELSGVDDGFLEWACAAWDVPHAPDLSAGTASMVPALLVYAPIDAIVPQQPALASGFPNASVLRLPTLGWEALRDGTPPCLNALRRAFLADPARRLDTDACSAQSPPIKFVIATP